MFLRWRTFIAAAGVSVLFAASSSVAAQKVHVVVAGQTPAGIAHRYGIPVADLCAMNQLPAGTRLHVGQKLLIPEPGEVARMQQRKRALVKAEPNANALAIPSDSAATALTADAPASEPSAPSSDVLQPPEPSSPPESAPPSAPPSSGEVQEPASKPTERTPVTQHTTTTAPERHVKPNPERQTHVVAQGNTTGKIAHRYHLKEESLLRANGLRRADRLKLGQT